MPRRQQSSEPQLTTIYWRDIPAQVRARAGGEKVAVQLSDRFQIAIDRAATRVGLTGTDAYLAEWREETRPCGGDLEEVVAAAVAMLEVSFTDNDLERLERSGGVAF